MALPIAPLGNLSSTGLFTGQVAADAPKLRDQLLAQLAAQIGGQLLTNVITHATGGDQTATAQGEGLTPETDRNVFQRFLGPQMSNKDLEELRTGKSTRELQAAQTAQAKAGATRTSELTPGEVEQQGLIGGLTKAQTRQIGAETQDVGQRQGRFEAQQALELAKMGQSDEQFDQGQAAADRRLQEQLANQLQMQANQIGSEEPLRTAQARDTAAQAVGREQINAQGQKMAVDQWIQSQLGGLPKELIPGRTKQLQAYTEQDSTPTSAEFKEWQASHRATTPSGETAPASEAPAVGAQMGDFTIQPSIADRVAGVLGAGEQTPEDKARGLLYLKDQAQGQGAISRQDQVAAIQSYQDAVSNADPATLEALNKILSGETPTENPLTALRSQMMIGGAL